MSSARFGLIPKSAGGRMALGGAGALGVAAGIRSYRNRSSSNVHFANERPVPTTLTDRRANDRKYMSMGGMSDLDITNYQSKFPEPLS